MFDVHYHLLFDTDDGPKSIEDSIALAEASIAEGVTHIVATPHSNLRYAFRPDLNEEKVQLLKERLEGRVVIGLGCDLHLSYDNITALERNPRQYTINGTQYVLVEFDEFSIPSSLSNVLLRVLSAGIIPIITHPERNSILAADSSRLVEWCDSGCLVQVTAGSFCGDFGRGAASVARALVRRSLVHLIASDAHSVRWRPPRMRKAYEYLIDEFGTAIADRLCMDNPRAVFLGEDLAGEAKDIQGVPSETKHPRRMLSRLLGKKA